MSLIDNIIAYYKYDNNTNDSVASNDATNNGATYNASGKINGCYTFDGSNDYMSSPITNNLTGAFSISCWIKSTSSNSQGVLSLRNVGGLDILIRIEADGFLYARSGSGGVIDPNTDTVIDGAWHHVVYTFDGTTCTLYLDGQVLGTPATGTGIIVSGFHIGKYVFASSTYMNGEIDEIGVWSVALSSGDVTELYNSGNGNQYPFSAAAVPDNAIFHSMNF